MLQEQEPALCASADVPATPVAAESPAAAVKCRLAGLKAIAKIVDPNDVRPWLRGVCLDQGPQGSIWVATDGNILMAHRFDAAPQPRLLRILPIAAIKALPGTGDGALVAGADGTVHLTHWGAYSARQRKHQDVMIEPIDGAYPKWRWIFDAAKCTGEEPKSPDFDPALLARIESCISEIADMRSGTAWRLIKHEDYTAALRYYASIYADVYAVVMPRHTQEGYVPFAAWMTDRETSLAAPEK